MAVVAAALGALLATPMLAGPARARSSRVAVAAVHPARPLRGLPIYRNRHYTFAERAADLVSRMTLAQKASQMDSSISPAIPSLGIPRWSWWNEALHGVSREGIQNNANPLVLTNTTSYPDDQSLGSTWDPKLIYDISSQISSEAREVMRDNTDNLDFYSPTMNLERDPRWGRTDEAYGEDPYLVSKEVSAYVNGLQGQTPRGRLPKSAHGYLKAIATIKHFVGYNDEDNRLTGSSNMDARTLREYYAMPFGLVARQAHPGSVMSSYNEVNGIPSPADEFLNQSLLRETFGFGGYLTSDCDAVYEITAGHHWQPPDYPRPVNVLERSAVANAAGEDLDCNQGYHDDYDYGNSLPADATSQIPTQTDTYNVGDMDASLVRLFTARMRTGEFDPAKDVPWVTQARKALPAHTWKSSNANHAVTETKARLALARRAADQSIVLLKNSATAAHGATGTLLPLQVPASGAYKIAVVGAFAHPKPSDLYLGDYASVQAKAGQRNDVDPYTGVRDAVLAEDPSATVDYIRGFTGDAQTTPDSVAQVDPSAIAQIEDGGYDAVIVVAGTDGSLESKQCPQCGTESTDRKELTLPGEQNTLINDVAAANSHTIVYMQTLGPMDVSAFEPNVPAMLWSSYNAQRQGQALADVLLGRTDPSGRLSATWYRSLAQIPEKTSNYAIRPGKTSPGRTYEYYDGAKGPVRYPFGYGLSYTSFAVSGLHLSATRLGANGALTATAEVKNTGALAGREVVQLYVGQPNALKARQRPIKRLEGFQAVSLKPGQTRKVTFHLTIPSLKYWDTKANRWSVDDGVYSVQVGTSSATTAAAQNIHVHGRLTPTLSVLTAMPVMSGDAARGIQQRVMFPEGATVEPQLTASLSNGTLYGYVHRGASRPMPRGLTIQYRSDHPRVVSVGRGERILTHRDGVATITATARLHGVSRSTSFVVDVVSELRAIRVNGRRVVGFHPDTLDYDRIVARGAATPHLEASVPAPDAAVKLVTIHQPAGVPGTGTIAITGSDGVRTRYTVHFAHPAKSDAFSGSHVGSQWSWVRHDAATATVHGGALRISEQPGTLAGTTNDLRNVLLQPALGNWTIESKLRLPAPPSADGQQAGIVAYQDDDDYLSLGWGYSSGKAQLVETSENGLSGQPVTATLASLPTAGRITGHRVWLRMTKRGARYTTAYSTNGRRFHAIDALGTSLTGDRVGVFAAAGKANGPVAAFGGFRVSNQAAGG